MRIIDLLSKDSISLQLQAKNKMEAINELVDLVDASGHLTDKKAYKEGIGTASYKNRLFDEMTNPDTEEAEIEYR